MKSGSRMVKTNQVTQTPILRICYQSESITFDASKIMKIMLKDGEFKLERISEAGIYLQLSRESYLKFVTKRRKFRKDPHPHIKQLMKK